MEQTKRPVSILDYKEGKISDEKKNYVGTVKLLGVDMNIVAELLICMPAKEKPGHDRNRHEEFFEDLRSTGRLRC